ncbi:ABC transporter permease subunit [Cysteiniphilum sp. JM-1]|uniref:ABC transporter permease subunit n=1 Tax=Cysteiniphilum sp. JM-1 TaxID=2610891 RepID=UPI00124412BF|nr:ABC transporter permease subunit [Cysteiniphilum sp. JM-1]
MNTIKLKNNYRKRNYSLQDVVFVMLVIAALGLMYYAWIGMHQSFINESSVAAISLDPSHLPYYTLRTVMRLLIGMVWSFAFALIAGYACAKNKHVARILLPIINFMESVPLLGFLTFTTAFFLFLFPHSVMGLEAAAIFGVFTSQAWNMALIVYQTIRIVPEEVIDASRVYKLNAWQRFWKIEMPYSVPGLLWNVMVSQSAAWFALVATEAIPVGDKDVMLPGVGAYISTALDHANALAIVYALIAIILTIVAFDQLVFRPLVKWSKKFKYEQINVSGAHSSWMHDLCTKSTCFNAIAKGIKTVSFYFINSPTIIARKLSLPQLSLTPAVRHLSTAIWYLCIITLAIWAGVSLWKFFPNGDMTYLLPLMWETTYRVAIAMGLSIVICTPLGIWIGISPKRTKMLQPIIQVMAAIPQPIFFPIVAILLMFGGGSLSIWAIPLIMTGTSWYVLFNVIAGASALPSDLIEMSRSFHLKGTKWWFKFAIPAVFPYIVCGIISAAGGAWNSAIAAELITWGGKTISISGIGELVSQTTSNNQIAEAALAVSAMCVLVALCVIFIWKPLYKLAETKYKI